MTNLKPYVSSAAARFEAGSFVTTWNADLGRNAVGIALSVEDEQEANPRIQVKWMHDLSAEFVRAEYLTLTTAEAFCGEAARARHDEVTRKWRGEAEKYEDAAREIESYDDRDEIDDEELTLNKTVAETLRECISDLLWPSKSSASEEEIRF